MLLSSLFRSCLLRIAVGLLVLLVINAFALVSAANWLHVKNEAVDADAAIVLAGDPSRAFYAADIFMSGYVRHIYISRAERLNSFRLLDDLGVSFPRREEIYRQVLLKKGVPEKAITIVGSKSISTVDEALVIKTLFSETPETLLVITSPYHIRRVQMIFRDVLPGIEFTVLATPYESFPEKWWRDQAAARNILLELAKIIFYRSGGRFHSG